MTRIEFTPSVSKLDAIEVRNTSRLPHGATFRQKLEISFQRTIRVPDNTDVSNLPPGLGRFPLYKVKDYAHRLPQDMVEKGGVFFPMHQKEAMWINFTANAPFMIKIYIGRINAISGQHADEDDETLKHNVALKNAGQSLQDYVVVPRQRWLDGVSVEPGAVRQFVAMPMGQGYTVEAQLTGQEAAGGLQFEITPAKLDPKNPVHIKTPPVYDDPPTGDGNLKIYFQFLGGKVFSLQCSSDDRIKSLKTGLYEMMGTPPDQQRLIHAGRQLEDDRTLRDYNIYRESTIFVVLRLRGGGTSLEMQENTHQMGLAGGGKIQQSIETDLYDSRFWFRGLTLPISVQILNSNAFRRVTGFDPPPCPLTARQYADAGLPFFEMFEESSAVSGKEAFASLKSVNELEQQKETACGVEDVVHPRTVELGNAGRSDYWWDKSNYDVLDAHGLVNPYGPFQQLRTISDLELRFRNKEC
ncbi:unnamed protein product [Discula destructiva]